MLHTCPWCNLCSKCYAMNCFGTCFTRVRDVTCAQSATPWTASVHTVHTLHTSRNLGWGGGVGWGAMTCTVLAHIFDATQLHLRTCWMLRNCTCARVRCYAIALAHMWDATQLHLRTCSMLRNCTCAHVRCYAIALAHMFDATQLHLRTCWMLRNCTCTHVRCYAIALAHMFDATQLHLRTWSMLRNCTCAHVGCHAIALAHMLDASQLHLRTCSMLRNCTYAHVRCYAKGSQQKERQRNVCRCPRTSRREGQAMDMACWTLACEPAFVQAAVPQTLSKGVLKKCETN